MDTINDSIFTIENFEHNHKVAAMLAESDLVPQRYKGNVGNVMVAMDIAGKFKVSPVTAMQHVQVFDDGNLGLSSAFIIALVNACGRFEGLDYKMTGEGDSLACAAFAKRKGETTIAEGPVVTIQMAKDEGWYSAEGSKWPTMPTLMIKYRAAAFFSRVHCPDITLGMQSREEVLDAYASRRRSAPAVTVISADDLQKMLDTKKNLLTGAELNNVQRIIDGNETLSFKKVQQLLNSKS